MEHIKKLCICYFVVVVILQMNITRSQEISLRIILRALGKGKKISHTSFKGKLLTTGKLPDICSFDVTSQTLVKAMWPQ